MRNTLNILRRFELKHKLKLVTQEAGFGQVVTGFIPITNHMFLNLSEDLTKSKPKDAYENCNILAVKGSDRQSYKELSNWIEALNQRNVKVHVFKNDNNGVQANETGILDYILMEESK